jgi:hypothetical protein
MNELLPDAALRPHSDVIAKRLDNAAVLVNIVTNQIFELNETGARIWELLGEGVHPTGIVSRLVDEFDVDEKQAVGELSNLLAQLRGEGLLTS